MITKKISVQQYAECVGTVAGSLKYSCPYFLFCKETKQLVPQSYSSFRITEFCPSSCIPIWIDAAIQEVDVAVLR